jgi:hypothetical protein
MIFRSSFKKLVLKEDRLQVFDKDEELSEIMYKDVSEVLFYKKFMVLKLNDGKKFEVKFEDIEYAYSVAIALDAKVKNEKK